MKTNTDTSARKDRIVRRFPLVLAVAAVVGLLFTWPGIPAYAHGESIEANPSEAKPGNDVKVTGKEFEAGEEVELTLEGVRGDIYLGHAEVNEDGSFAESFTIPSGAAVGSYQLVAATGDDKVTVDFTVLQGGEAASSPGSTAVVFQRSSTETIVIGLIAVALVASGTLLVFTEARKRARFGRSRLSEERRLAREILWPWRRPWREARSWTWQS